MQGAETSTMIFPCGRRVHLHKTVSSKTIFKQIQNDQKNDVELGTHIVEQTIKTPSKLSRKKKRIIETYYLNYVKLSDIGFHFGASCLIDSRSAAFLFFATCFSEPLRGTPWNDFGLPWGTLDTILSILWKSVGANLLQTSKIPEQQIAPTTPPKTSKHPQTLYQ